MNKTKDQKHREEISTLQRTIDEWRYAYLELDKKFRIVNGRLNAIKLVINE